MLEDIKLGFLKNPADISLLQKISVDKIKALVAEVNNLDTQNLAGRELIIAIGTGGTISMKEEGGIRIPDLNFENIFNYADSKLKELFQVKSFDAFSIDSSQMDYSHTRELAIAMIYIYENIKKPFSGFLIIHGTDTMAFSGAALSLMTGRGLPFAVCYTGAQKPIQELMNDAGTNLRNALLTLQQLKKQNMAEVVIVFGDRAMLANGTIKVDDEKANAFDSPLHKYVASFKRLQYPIQLSPHLKERRKQKFTPEIWQGDFSHTLVVHSMLGLSAAMVEQQITNPQVRAVILYSYGASTAYDGIIQTIAKVCTEKQIPAFVVNPVGGDAAKIRYLSAKEMNNLTIIPLLMTLPAALVKIEVALRKFPNNLEKIARFMVDNYVGEVPVNGSSAVGDK